MKISASYHSLTFMYLTFLIPYGCVKVDEGL